ncbi:unnamed protein product [Rotaria sp. Silwood1]|nr:unnamed protein product [Rotaria sp. Silwood1]CAF4678665.1 unnamed protein product [Rotaria sp. Silwood1]CAF4731326.1 unnamed protein product [Rotaria sp. Silwood1]
MLKSQPLLLEISENIQQQRINVENDSDLMFSIRDGYHGYRFDQDSLLIQLYLDDIGLTNPLGAKRDKHKMTMVYFSLEDVPDKYRSKLDFIQLVAVCESKTLKDDIKAQRFFAPIIENLNKLQLHGISINGIHLTFSFSTVVADNLASHFVGGFQSCFSSGHFCRRCYITYPEKNLPIPLSQIPTRSMIDHDDLVDKIINDPNRVSLKGVIGPSPLRELIGFHAITSLPRDLMHDFIEGICPMIIISLLKQASALRILTYIYKVLREILDLILSYPFRKKWLHVLGELCDTFHETMLSHFPDKVKPKEHFIREYKYMINDFGPAVKQWCFRYEANHSYFKKIAVRTSNFKNIPKMLVTRYRLKQCLTFGHLSRLQSTQYPIGIKKVRSTCFDSPMKDILLKHFDHIDFDKDLYQCNTLIYDNVEYRRCGVYVIDLKPSHEQPVFAQTIMIIKKNEKWWLLVDILDTICYNEKLSAWQIQSLTRYSLIDPNDLVYYYKGLDIYMVNNLSFVTFISQQDVDGPMLKMLNNVERISPLIPKLKQQLIFLEEREKLFRKIDDGSISCDGPLSNTSTIPKTSIFTLPNPQTSPAVSINSKSSSTINLSNTNLSSTMSMDNSTTDQVIIAAGVSSSFPDVYEVPILPKALLKNIEAGNLKSFGPHCQGRQILIDAVVHDLMETYNLLYLSKTQYNVVGSALLRCLKLPSTLENLAIWKDALQTKLKRTRNDHPNNDLVQEFRLKYSKLGSGRPVKQKIGEIAEHDRHKQVTNN